MLLSKSFWDPSSRAFLLRTACFSQPGATSKMTDTDRALHHDVEKRAADNDATGYDGYSAEKARQNSVYDREFQTRHGSITPHHEGFFQAFQPGSFKRNHNARVVTEATDAEGRPLPDQPPAERALAMKLKGRHLQMIAIGGSIGASAHYYLGP